MEWNYLKDILIFITALTGMTLGIWNFSAYKRKKKLMLKVIPKSTSCIGNLDVGKRSLKNSANIIPLVGESDQLAIEIVNMGLLPITVSEVGFHASNKIKRFAIQSLETIDGGNWPRRLEKKEKVTVLLNGKNFEDRGKVKLIKGAYAKTDCGAYITGYSKALKSFVRKIVNRI